jgi:hypothetical protein
MPALPFKNYTQYRDAADRNKSARLERVASALPQANSIFAKINFVRSRLLVDTGAAFSCVSRKFFRDLKF